jgi:type I restriction enzyme, S subunit
MGTTALPNRTDQMGAKIPKTIQESDDIFTEDLPEGWMLTSVGELFQIVGGGTPSTKNPEYWEGDIPWISSADIYGVKKIVPRRTINQNAIENSAAHLVPKGSIIVVTRVSLGRIAICDTPISFSQDCHALIPKTDSVDPEFALFYLSQAVQTFQSQSRGTTISGVTVKVVSSLPFPLPTLAEQQRIVARIEALLAHIDAARERLSRVPLIMKKFRQAVLAAACSGRLTEGWREENPDVESATVLLEKISLKREKKKIAHLKNVEPLIDELSDLSENWIWTQLGFITESMKNGVYKTPNFYKDDGFPCLRMYNIEDGKIIWKNIKHMDLTGDEIKMYLLKHNDILINRVNSRELVGKSALITEKIEPCVYESKNIRLRMYNEEIKSQYVVCWLQVNAQKYFNLNAQQTVGMASINQDQIASMPIPLPPLAEQHEIVGRVGLLFERADAFDQEVVAASLRCERLTQAVLGKAFRGELVGSDKVKI